MIAGLDKPTMPMDGKLPAEQVQKIASGSKKAGNGMAPPRLRPRKLPRPISKAVVCRQALVVLGFSGSGSEACPRRSR